MNRHLLLCCLVLAGAVASASADQFLWRDASGRTWLSNHPPPAGAMVEYFRPDADATGGAANLPLSSPPPLLSDSPDSPTPPDVPRQVYRPASEAAVARRAAPVDTRELGMIREGMSEASVHRRLGEPVVVEDLGTIWRVVRDEHTTRRGVVEGRDATIVPITRTRWVYGGTNQVPPAVIEFRNGRVERTGRVR
jgi:hypothetical protein